MDYFSSPASGCGASPVRDSPVYHFPSQDANIQSPMQFNGVQHNHVVPDNNARHQIHSSRNISYHSPVTDPSGMYQQNAHTTQDQMQTSPIQHIPSNAFVNSGGPVHGYVQSHNRGNYMMHSNTHHGNLSTHGSPHSFVSQTNDGPCRVILLSLAAGHRALTVEEAHALCSPFGTLLRIVLVVKAQKRAMVEFASPIAAQAAIIGLDKKVLHRTATGVPLVVPQGFGTEEPPPGSPLSPSLFPLSTGAMLEAVDSITPPPLHIVANNDRARDFTVFPLPPSFLPGQIVDDFGAPMRIRSLLNDTATRLRHLETNKAMSSNTSVSPPHSITLQYAASSGSYDANSLNSTVYNSPNNNMNVTAGGFHPAMSQQQQLFLQQQQQLQQLQLPFQPPHGSTALSQSQSTTYSHGSAQSAEASDRGGFDMRSQQQQPSYGFNGQWEGVGDSVAAQAQQRDRPELYNSSLHSQDPLASLPEPTLPYTSFSLARTPSQPIPTPAPALASAPSHSRSFSQPNSTTLNTFVRPSSHATVTHTHANGMGEPQQQTSRSPLALSHTPSSPTGDVAPQEHQSSQHPSGIPHFAPPRLPRPSSAASAVSQRSMAMSHVSIMGTGFVNAPARPMSGARLSAFSTTSFSTAYSDAGGSVKGPGPSDIESDDVVDSVLEQVKCTSTGTTETTGSKTMIAEELFLTTPSVPNASGVGAKGAREESADVDASVPCSGEDDPAPVGIQQPSSFTPSTWGFPTHGLSVADMAGVGSNNATDAMVRAFASLSVHQDRGTDYGEVASCSSGTSAQSNTLVLHPSYSAGQADLHGSISAKDTGNGNGNSSGHANDSNGNGNGMNGGMRNHHAEPTSTTVSSCEALPVLDTSPHGMYLQPNTHTMNTSMPGIPLSSASSSHASTSSHGSALTNALVSLGQDGSSHASYPSYTPVGLGMDGNVHGSVALSNGVAGGVSGLPDGSPPGMYHMVAGSPLHNINSSHPHQQSQMQLQHQQMPQQSLYPGAQMMLGDNNHQGIHNATNMPNMAVGTHNGNSMYHNNMGNVGQLTISAPNPLSAYHSPQYLPPTHMHHPGVVQIQPTPSLPLVSSPFPVSNSALTQVLMGASIASSRFTIPLTHPHTELVLWVRNMPPVLATPYRIAVLMGIYGNVLRARVCPAVSPYGAAEALVVFSQPDHAERAKRYLHGLHVLSHTLQVISCRDAVFRDILSISPGLAIIDDKTYMEYPRHPVLTADFTSCAATHRFSGHHSRNTKHVCRPAHELHVSNLPSAHALERLVGILAFPPATTPTPSVLPGARPGDGYIVSDPQQPIPPMPQLHVASTRLFAGDPRMGFLRFNTLGEAALAVVALHDYPMGRIAKSGDAHRVKLTFAHM